MISTGLKYTDTLLLYTFQPTFLLILLTPSDKIPREGGIEDFT